MKKIRWVVFGFLSIGVGLYPLLYGLVDMSSGLMGRKSPELLAASVWFWFFYQHIVGGALALLTGWTQFSKKWRARHIGFHRFLGKVYVTAVMLSGIAGTYLAFYATGGAIAGFGFGALGVLWLSTTAMAFVSIRQGRVQKHEQWMIRSYALCWSAVTLRLWLPILQGGFGLDFLSAYLLVSWLCWVPNLIIAEVIVRSYRRSA